MNPKGFYKNLLMILSLMVSINVSLIFAAVYYVDATNENDNNYGLSPSVVWKTLPKVLTSQFMP